MTQPPASGRSDSLAKIIVSGSVTAYTQGETEFVLDVVNVRQLFKALAVRYPHIPDTFEADLAVAIDGEIYQDALLQPIRSDSEVHLFPRIEGG